MDELPPEVTTETIDKIFTGFDVALNELSLIGSSELDSLIYESKLKHELEAIRINHLEFLSKITIVNSCWEYSGSIHGNGYRRARLLVDGRVTWIYAHRYSYIHYFGSIPRGTVVMHRCDNRICVNPMHLWCGTQKENIEDKFAKGRENIRPLSPGQVMDIYSHKNLTMEEKQKLADKHGVSMQTVNSIIYGRTHRKITGAGDPDKFNQ